MQLKTSETDTLFLRADFGIRYGQVAKLMSFLKKRWNFKNSTSHGNGEVDVFFNFPLSIFRSLYSQFLFFSFDRYTGGYRFLSCQRVFFEKEKSANILLVKSSVRVDVVAMPRLSLQELKNAGVDVSMEESKEIISDVPPSSPQKNSDSVEFKVKKKDVNFQDMLKKYSEKKKSRKSLATS